MMLERITYVSRTQVDRSADTGAGAIPLGSAWVTRWAARWVTKPLGRQVDKGIETLSIGFRKPSERVSIGFPEAVVDARADAPSDAPEPKPSLTNSGTATHLPTHRPT